MIEIINEIFALIGTMFVGWVLGKLIESRIKKKEQKK